MNSFTQRRVLFVALFLAHLAGATSRAADDLKLPPERPDLVPGAGRELVLGQCILCHSVDYISTQPPLTRIQWQAIVDKMRVRYGAPFNTNQAPAIVDYLTAAYGQPASPMPASRTATSIDKR